MIQDDVPKVRKPKYNPRKKGKVNWQNLFENQ